MADVALTEFVDLDVDELHLVKDGANGFPALVAKAAAEEVAATADELAAKAGEPEPDDDEDEPAVKACGVADCEVCAPLIAKGKLKAAQRKALPKSSFAIPEKAPGSGSYPLPDEAHARSALSRVAQHGTPDEQKRVKAAVRRKFPNIDQEDEGDAEKSPGVPDASLQIPDPESLPHTTDTGTSGQRIAPMTAGTITRSPEEQGGGQSTYVIPIEAQAFHPPAGESMDQALGKASEVLIGVVETLEKDAPWSTATGIGSAPWESVDSATLAQVAQSLASCGMAIDAIQKREQIEAAAGDAGDQEDAWDLADAASALECALGIVARLAFHEGAASDAMKAGRRLSARTVSALRAAHAHLTDVLGEHQPAGDTGSTSEEDKIMTQLTKEELSDLIAGASGAAAAAAVKALAEKNANNGGDVTQADLEAKVTGESAANDVAVVGAPVDSRFTAKEAATEDVADLRKELGDVKALLEKMAAKPRAGGPVLDGIARGAYPASEGRQSEDVAKSAEDAEIERLEKSLEEALSQKGPEAVQRASTISYDLTRRKLLQGHRRNEI